MRGPVARHGLALLLVLVLALPLGLAWGQAGGPAALRRRVRLAPGHHSLGAVLADLSRQSGLAFSYSSSLVPLGQPYFLPAAPPRPAGEVLREVLAAGHLTYGIVGGQLVLWPAPTAAAPGLVAVGGRVARATASTARPATGAQGPAGPWAPVAGQRSPGTSPLALAERVARRAPPAGPLAVAGQSRAAAFTSAYPLPRGRATRAGSLDRVAARSLALPSAGWRAAASRALGRALPLASRPAAMTTAGRATTAAAHRAYPADSRPAAGRESLEVLAFRSAFLAPVGAPAGSFLPSSDLLKAPLTRRPRADSVAPKLALAPRRPLYLHGEAWVAETLPLTVAGKLGWPRLYLVLGVAAGPFDSRGGRAWGGGLGTVGQPKGRFTLSLDVLHWVIAGGDHDDGPRGHLTQLRPALAWQLKREGRWQLVGGPTLNLATASDPDPNSGRPGFSPRHALGQGQWNWLDADGGRTNTHLWPGVQVGVRF